VIIFVDIVQDDIGTYLCVEKYTQTMFIVRHHTLEAMHFGIVELWSTFFSSDSNKASASISPASEASATCFPKKKKKKYITGSFADRIHNSLYRCLVSNTSLTLTYRAMVN
jgi:hypothetical protein